MKKTIFSAILIFAVALMIAINVNLTGNNSNHSSTVTLADVEALAGEHIDPLDPKNPKPQEGFQATLVSRERWDVKVQAFVKESSWECIRVNVSVSCTIRF